ncbi:peptidylprolyl isomerase [Elusimicrobiota bacterium]
MKTNYITYLLIVSFFLSGCTRKEDVVAYVGNRKITVSEFKRRVKELPEYYLGFISTEGGKRQYLSGIIKEEVLLRKGNELNIDKDPQVVQRLKDVKREMLLASVIDRLQTESVKVSDQDVKDYYDDNAAEYSNPEQIKISHILLPDEATAKEVLEKLKGKYSFENMAREYSIDTVTAINGGDLGYFGRGEMLQPEFEKQVFALEKVGQISDTIKTPFGYHIAKLTGRRRGRKKTFEEAENEIRLKLEKEKFNEIIDTYRRDYGVRVKYDVLDDIKFVEEEKEKEVQTDEE